MAESIEFRLKVIEDKLGVALDQNEKKAKSLGSALSTAIGTFAGQAAIKGFSLLGNAIGSVNDFIFDSIAASAKQQESLNKLGQALRTTGEFSKSAVDDFAAFASELQNASTLGDEVILEQIAIAKSFGATNQQAKDLVQAAANLSATFGTELSQNVKNLGKTFSGLTGELGEALPELKTLGKEALISGEAIGLINSKFAGAAQAELNTYTGSLTSLKNSFGDLTELFGDVVTQSDLVKSGFQFLSESINSAIESVKKYRAEQEAQKNGFVDASSEVNLLSIKYADLTAEIEKQQAIINKQGPNKGLVSTADVQAAETRVKSLSAEAERLFQIIQKSQEQITAEEAKTPDRAAKVRAKTQDELRAIEERSIAIQELENQAVLQSNQFSLENDIAKKEATFSSREEEIAALADFEYTKTELQYQAELARAELLATEEEKATARKKAELNKRINEQKIANSTEKKINEAYLKDRDAFLSTAVVLTSSKNKELAAIGKAAALTQLAINSKEAFGSSYKFGLAISGGNPAVGAVFGGIAAAAIAQQAAQIAGIKGYAGGGIIGATNGGDNRIATVRDGEMVLNAEQQKSLFESINNGGNSGNIVIQIDGRNIAYAVRDQVKQGFKLE